MANEEQLELLRQGVSGWNAWRHAHPEIKIDLSGAALKEAALKEADLSEADLRGAHLTEADLRDADLRGADLSGANLQDAHLSNVNLCDANLTHAKLDGAFLSRANLHKAHLRGVTLILTNLTEANLSRVDLTKACFLNTILGNMDLTEAQGLDCCEHWGPSIIDHHTLAKSGRLPLSFLRGCGLPDVLINFLPSLLDEPIQFYSCFISYAHQDEPFAQRLHDTLQGKGVRCWYAPEDIHGGKKLHEQINEAIRVYDKLLLILSEHSMNSEWVQTEIANARRQEATQKRQILFPIRLVDYEIISTWTCFDANTGKDSAREIREYFIPDFSNWKDHDSFEKAFARLLRDLKADETQTST
jgi:hypothetical protein